MKHRPKPNPATYSSSRNTRLKKDPQVKKWAKRLLGDPNAKPEDLTEEQLVFVYEQILGLRPTMADTTKFEQAMIDTCPVLSAPDWTGLVEDMGHVWAQPEMRRFWEEWQPPREGSGPRVDYAPAKAIMATLGMGGFTSKFDDAHDRFGDTPQLREVFSDLEGRPVEQVPYSSLMRQLKKASKGVRVAAMKHNIELVKQLAELFPGEGIGERLAIDATAFPAWCPQRGSRNDAVDEIIGRRTPDAAYRIQEYRKGSKEEVDPNEQVQAGKVNVKVKAFRGYFLVAIIDLATGLPLVWVLMTGKTNETAALIPLLSTLYRLWPEIPAKLIVGDSLYDDDICTRVCEVDYGIAPVFRIHKAKLTAKSWRIFHDGESRDGSVKGMTPLGQLVCAKHGGVLPYATFERPHRTVDGKKNGIPLRPGQSADEGGFRIRAMCDGTVGCGKLSLQAKVDWSVLTEYPHFKDGAAKKYWLRQALLVRLNGIESLWNRVKSGGLGVNGADRPRVLDRETVEAVVSLAMLGYTAFTVADQRRERKIGPYAPTAITAQPTATSAAPQVPAPASPPVRIRRKKPAPVPSALIRLPDGRLLPRGRVSRFGKAA